MVGIEGGTDLARGDEPILLVGVVEPEIGDGGSAEGLLEGGNTRNFQSENDDPCTSFSSADVLDLFSSLSTGSPVSIGGGEADRFLPLVTLVEEPASEESVATMASAFRAADRACLRGDRSSGTLLK